MNLTKAEKDKFILIANVILKTKRIFLLNTLKEDMTKKFILKSVKSESKKMR